MWGRVDGNFHEHAAPVTVAQEATDVEERPGPGKCDDVVAALVLVDGS